MQGHKFEDNLHKKMVDLSLRPTEGVWNQVEVALRKDRKRRRLFFLLPLFLVIVLGSYWWIQQAGKPNVTIADKNAIKETSTLPTNSKAVTGEPGKAKQNQANDTKRKTPDNNQRVVISPGSPLATSPKNNLTSSETVNRETGLRKEKKSGTRNQLSVAVSSEPVRKKNKKDGQADRITNPPGNRSITESAEVITTKEVEIVSDKLKSNRNKKVEEAENSSIVVEKKDSLVEVRTPPKTDSISGIEKIQFRKIQSPGKFKWQWGITADAGIARVVQGGLINAFEKSLVMDAAVYNGSVQTPGSSGYIKPAFINAGFNWSSGFFMQRKLGDRIQLSAGLQYNYFSTHNSIGSRIDSTRIINNGTSNSLRVEGYYRNGTDGNYTSNYHFLELPITLHVQLTKTKRTPFYWNSGLSIGRLLSTNALHYDGSTGFYYKDDNLFRRTQLAFHTGLSMKFFARSQYPLEMGPQFHYKLSNLLHSNNNDQRHLLSGSLYVRWFLNK